MNELVTENERLKDLSYIFDEYTQRMRKFEFDSTRSFHSSITITLNSITKIKIGADPSLKKDLDALMTYFESLIAVIPDISFDAVRRKSQEENKEKEKEQKRKREQKSESQLISNCYKRIVALENQCKDLENRDRVTKDDFEEELIERRSSRSNQNKTRVNDKTPKFKSKLVQEIRCMKREDIRQVIDFVQNKFQIK